MKRDFFDDDRFPRSEKMVTSMFKGFFALWAVYVVGCLALIIAVICVVAHFISKFW